MLLGVVEVLHRCSPEITFEHFEPALGFARYRDDSLLDPDLSSAASPDGADHDRSAAIDISVEQAVQGDDRLVMGGGGVDEIDHDSGFLARVATGDSTDPLLVDPPRSGRRKVHANGRSG